MEDYCFNRSQDDLVLHKSGKLKTGKREVEEIKTRNLGADRVKEARLQTLITEFENLKMSDNDTIDTYAAKLSGIASNSATLGEVMSEHKLVKKFLTSLPRWLSVALEQVLDLETIGFEDVVGLNIPTRMVIQAVEEDVAHTLEVMVEVEDVVRATLKTKCYRYDQYGHFVSRCPERNRNHQVNLNETQEKCMYHEEVLQERDCVKIKQERYARKILKEAGMEDCNATLYPMEKDIKLSKAETCFLPWLTSPHYMRAHKRQTTVALVSCEDLSSWQPLPAASPILDSVTRTFYTS
ncbi:hypothetical protein Tco_0246549 [Tanacetum coccineum]